MSAFLGAIGFIGLIVGIVLMIVGWIKKKKYKGGLIALVSLVLFIIAVVTTPNNEKASSNVDQTDTYKVTDGKITNNKLLINLAVRAETIIEKYDKINNVKVDEDNITAEKMPDMKDENTGDEYKNVYSITGQYSWKEKRYDFEWIVSFDKNDVEASGKVLKYSSEMNGSQIDVKMSSIK